MLRVLQELGEVLPAGERELLGQARRPAAGGLIWRERVVGRGRRGGGGLVRAPA